MLNFRMARTSRRAPTSGAAHAIQRKGVWLAMGLMVVVTFFGQDAWRQHRARVGAYNAEGMTDNVVTKPGSGKPGEKPVTADELIMPGELKLPDAKPMLAIDGKRLFGGLTSQDFAPLQDDSVWRSDENGVFFKVMKALADADPQALAKASTGRKTFVQLFKQSNEYRGEIVTIGGRVASIKTQPQALANDQGIKSYHEVWFFPDGTPHMPMAVVVLDLPPGLKAGSNATFDATGYFYKRLGYASREPAQGGATQQGLKEVFRSSPVILAKSLTIRPASAAPPAATDAPSLLERAALPFPSKYLLPIIGGGMILLTALGAWAYRLSRTSVRHHGPIVGRRRDDEAEVTNLNAMHLEP